jgi:hypothetical protein
MQPGSLAVELAGHPFEQFDTPPFISQEHRMGDEVGQLQQAGLPRRYRRCTKERRLTGRWPSDLRKEALSVAPLGYDLRRHASMFTDAW